jgi:hopanoid biosynthesis associated protein HpnK
MVAGAAAADAVSRARRMPDLRVGLHLTLVEDVPALPSAEIPALTSRNGRFRSDMGAMALRIAFDPSARKQLSREIAAQLSLFEKTGLRLDHLNAHKHFHLHPTIAGLAIGEASRLGLRAIRIPDEPRAVIAAIEPQTATSPQTALLWAAARLQARAKRHGIFAPDHVFGLAWSGAMTAPRLAALIDRLPEGVSEIYTHPAVSDAFAGSAPGYRYRDELAALTDPAIVAAVKDAGLRLGGYSDFADG